MPRTIAESLLSVFTKTGLTFRFGISFFNSFDQLNSKNDIITKEGFAGLREVTSFLTLTSNNIQIPQKEIIYTDIPTAGIKKNERVAIGYNISGDLVIKNPFGIANDYFSWFRDAVDSINTASVLVFKNCLIQQIDGNGNIIKNIFISKCRPKAYKSPNFNSLEEAISIEELTLSVEGDINVETFIVPIGVDDLGAAFNSIATP